MHRLPETAWNILQWIHTYIHYITLIHTYITLHYITYIHTYITYTHTYITLHYITLHYVTLRYVTLRYIHNYNTYIHTCIHTYIHIYIYTPLYIHIIYQVSMNGSLGRKTCAFRVLQAKGTHWNSLNIVLEDVMGLAQVSELTSCRPQFNLRPNLYKIFAVCMYIILYIYIY